MSGKGSHEPVSDELTLTDWISVLSRQRLLALGVFCVVLLLGGLASLGGSATYEARAVVLLRTATSQQLFPEVGPSQSAFFRRSAAAELEYAQSTEFRTVAREQSPDGAVVIVSILSGDADAAAITVRTSNQLRFEATADNEADAVAAANAWAGAYVNERAANARSETLSAIEALESEVQLLQDEIGELSAPLDDIDAAILEETDLDAAEVLATQRGAVARSLEPQISPLRSQLGTLSSDLSSLRVRARQLEIEEISARVSQDAVQASSSEASTSRNLVLAAVVGAILAVGAAVLRDNLRGRIDTRREFEMVSALPVFAVVPSEDGEAADHAREEIVTCLERLAGVEAGGRRVVFASPKAVSAASATLIADLTSAVDGRSGGVVVIDADLRSAFLTEAVSSVARTPGVADLLRGDADLGSLPTPAGHPGVDLIAAGDATSSQESIAAQLRSDRFANAVDKFAADYRLTLVSGGPVLGISDTGALLDAVGGHVVLVVELGAERRDDVVEAIERLSSAGHPSVGVVLLDAR